MKARHVIVRIPGGPLDCNVSIPADQRAFWPIG
jgi:hypothetical protein